MEKKYTAWRSRIALLICCSIVIYGITSIVMEIGEGMLYILRDTTEGYIEDWRYIYE